MGNSAEVKMADTMEPREGSSIPTQEFIEDVAGHTKKFNTVQEALTAQDTMLSKYRFMEQQMLAQRQALLAKRPDLQRSVNMVEKLIQARDDADAEIPVSEELEVGLWLGANVMVQFPLDEAIVLVRDNLSQCETIIDTLDRDIDFVKDQIVTSEVNIARIYNNDVRERQAKA